MISKLYRLKRWRVQKVQKKGETLRIGLFIIKLLPNKLNFHRFALVLSRKFSKLAADRNKKRRQIYESIRLTTASKEEKESKNEHYDIVLIPYKEILTCKYNKIQENINNILNSINSK